MSRSRIRSIKRRDERGPWRGETSERHVLLECSYGRENRACVLGDDCWVDKYASQKTPDVTRQIHVRSDG